jgi:integrase
MEALLYRTAAMTGLRQGELLALRWRDVDWIASCIRVRRTYVRDAFDTPKSLRSSRSVPLAKSLARELEDHSRRSAFTGDDDLVFGHATTGQPLRRGGVLRRFKAATKRAGLGERRFHDLRHTFGTRMAATPGVTLRTLQEWLGHRDLATTLIYADYAPASREAALVEAAFAGTVAGTELSETEGNAEGLESHRGEGSLSSAAH